VILYILHKLQKSTLYVRYVCTVSCTYNTLIY